MTSTYNKSISVATSKRSILIRIVMSCKTNVVKKVRFPNIDIECRYPGFKWLVLRPKKLTP